MLGRGPCYFCESFVNLDDHGRCPYCGAALERTVDREWCRHNMDRYYGRYSNTSYFADGYQTHFYVDGGQTYAPTRKLR